MDPSLFPETLMSLLKTPRRPVVVDVRKRPAFEGAPSMLPNEALLAPRCHRRFGNSKRRCRKPP
jgi:hypothetical protein